MLLGADSAKSGQVARLLAAARARAESVVVTGRRGRELTPAELSVLETVWHDLVDALESAVGKGPATPLRVAVAAGR